MRMKITCLGTDIEIPENKLGVEEHHPPRTEQATGCKINQHAVYISLL